MVHKCWSVKCDANTMHDIYSVKSGIVCLSLTRDTDVCLRISVLRCVGTGLATDRSLVH